MNKEAAGRYTETYRHWDMVCMGYKGNMFDIQAALLLPQLQRIDKNLERREEISARYREAFGPMEEIELPRDPPRHPARPPSFYHLGGPKRDAFLERLQDQGIGVAVNYRPVHLLTFYRRKFGCCEGLFPIAEHIGRKTLSLPLYPKMTDREVAAVIRAVQKGARWRR